MPRGQPKSNCLTRPAGTRLWEGPRAPIDDRLRSVASCRHRADDMMTRRTFLGGVGGGLATARATGAARAESRRYRIGIMEAPAASANAAQLAPLRRGLEEPRHVAPQQVVLQY